MRGGDAHRRAIWCIGHLDAQGLARFGLAHAAFANQRSALGQVVRGDQAGHWYWHKVAVGHVQATVGIGQAFGFGDQVHRLRCWLKAGGQVGFLRLEVGQGVARVALFQSLQGAEDLRYRHTAR